MAPISRSAIPDPATPGSALSLSAVLALLVCPVCHGTLARAEPSIECTACGRRYPLRDGIPVLIAAEATPPPRF